MRLLLCVFLLSSCSDFRTARGILKTTPELVETIHHAARNYPPEAQREIYEQAAPEIIRAAADEDEAAQILRAAFDH